MAVAGVAVEIQRLPRKRQRKWRPFCPGKNFPTLTTPPTLAAAAAAASYAWGQQVRLPEIQALTHCVYLDGVSIVSLQFFPPSQLGNIINNAN